MSGAIRVFFKTDQHLYWQIDGQAEQRLEKSSLTVEQKKSIKIIWVPTAMVAIGHQNVPGKRQSDWMAALPFTVEEKLSLPIENYHLAIIDRKAAQEDGITGQSITFAAVKHSQMQAWKAKLVEFDLLKVALVPDCYALIGESSCLSYQEGERALYRWDEFMGASLHAQIPASQLTSQTFEPAESSLMPSIQLKTNANRIANLMTGSYAPQGKNSMKLWRIPIILVSLLLLTLLLQSWFQASNLKQATQTYQLQTEQLFKSMFPEINRIVNIKAQTINQFRDVDANRLNPSFMELLQPLQKILLPIKEIKIDELRWQARANSLRLSLDLTSTNTSQLQLLEQKVQKVLPNQKVSVKVKKVQNTVVKGVLNVESK